MTIDVGHISVDQQQAVSLSLDTYYENQQELALTFSEAEELVDKLTAIIKDQQYKEKEPST